MAAMRRRDAMLAVGTAPLARVLAAEVSGMPAPGTILERAIPASGERLPCVGLGTWLTFHVDIGNAPAMAQRRAVLERFFAGGGRVIDSSPMYAQAEQVLGELLARPEPRLFAATKVWTPVGSYGPVQMRRSMALWHLPRVDLMQVHNLLAWRSHLPTLREWKARGLTRYIGVTTSHGRDADLVRTILDTQRGLDFLQVTYNPADRSAEPLIERAADRGVAVIVNRPFDGGALLDRLAPVPLPAVAAELGCAHWATLVLKWELAFPGVCIAIPATTQPEHVAQNLAALRGPLPDRRQREAIRRAVEPYS
jgi:diketogulonate reductase-like aldo/keto reductase